jgi:hypothetical protein
MKKTYNVSLNPEDVKAARIKLEVGQSLSPIINELLKKWIEGETKI